VSFSGVKSCKVRHRDTGYVSTCGKDEEKTRQSTHRRRREELEGVLHLHHSTVRLCERRRADAVAQELGGLIKDVLVLIRPIFGRQ
jgi:hypothetical protein